MSLMLVYCMHEIIYYIHTATTSGSQFASQMYLLIHFAPISQLLTKITFLSNLAIRLNIN